MSILKHVIEYVHSITLKDIVYLVIMIMLIIGLIVSIKTCTNNSLEYKNNIKALNDTIRTYQDKNGNLVATKLAFEAELKDIKLLNADLYEQIKSLKAKGNITSGVHFGGVIENPQNDTTFIVKHDTIINGFSKYFDFNNEYRILEGNVSYRNDSVGININKDQIMFDYIVALDDKNNIMIRSTNPYVKYNEMTGFQLPKNKKQHWYLGPSISAGYDPINNKPSISIGVSIGYGLFKW